MPKAKLTTRERTTSNVSTDNLNKGSELSFAEADSNFINLRDRSWGLADDSSTVLQVTDDKTITIAGGTNVTTALSGDTLTINATATSSTGDLSIIGSTISAPSNADLTLDTSGTGNIVFKDNVTGEGNATFSGTLECDTSFTLDNLEIVTSPNYQIKNDTNNFIRIEEIGFVNNRIVPGYDSGSTGKDLDIIIDPTYGTGQQFNIIDRLNVSTQYDSGGGGTLNANDGKRLTMGSTAALDPFTGYSGYRTLFNKGGTDHVFTIFGYTASGTPPKLFHVDNGEFSNNNTVQIRDYEFNTSEEITTINTNQDIKLNPNGTGTVDLNVPTSTTIGSNGSASAPTANPVGYIKIKVGGTDYQVPYYNI